MALRLSAQMTVMQNAAQRASKRLLRDFNEVEQFRQLGFGAVHADVHTILW